MWGDKSRGYSRHVSFDIHSDHPFTELIAEACRGRHGISVTPKKGRALMFSSVYEDMTADQHTWHCGCNVIRGVKIIMQKFKELPMAERSLAVGPMQPADPYRPYQPTI